MSEEIKNNAQPGENNYIEQEEESSIDFGKLFADVKKHKKLYYKVLPITFLLAAIYALSIPNYYQCTVKLSPELSGSRAAMGLSSLASSFGFNIGQGTAGMGTEALFPTLYPDLVNSTDFKTSLFNVPVTIEGNKKKGTPDRTMSYYDYLQDEQKSPWWSSVIAAPFKALAWLLAPKDTDEVKPALNPFRLTKKQALIVKALDRKVVCDIDKKTMVISIQVTDQNPVIAATMADTVQQRLQDFITDYRTKKVKVDLDYYKKICEENKAKYEDARQRYSEFVDANQYIILQTVRQQQTDLENEMQFQYNAYSQIASQLIAAEAKVQEETPAFTRLQSATVPTQKAGPSRAKMCLVFLFLAFIGTTVWILHKEDDLKSLLGMS